MKLKHLSQYFSNSYCAFLSVRIDAQIINGADLLFSENLNLINGKSVAVVCNHSSLLSNGTHLVDSLLSLKDVKVIVTFTPEHGFKGDEEAGKNIDYKNNLYKEVPIVSLYGKDKKPSKEILKDVDVLIFDIQDVGASFYTYISTLYLLSRLLEKIIFQLLFLIVQIQLGEIMLMDLYLIQILNHLLVLPNCQLLTV